MQMKISKVSNIGMTCRYLFNVRDGCQRVCSEHAIRLSRIKCIFISRISPQTLGGLPGIAFYCTILRRYVAICI